MPNVVLGLQAAIASGAEQTFDGQPMQPGVHLRWSFPPELGFPPWGFRLCRRIEERVPSPPSCSEFVNPLIPVDTASGVPANIAIGSTTIASTATVTIPSAGISDTLVTAAPIVASTPADPRAASGSSAAAAPQLVAPGAVTPVAGAPVATSAAMASMAISAPPQQPGWGKSDQSGWQCLGVPFTLPVTDTPWPARYYGAPNPNNPDPAFVQNADILEAIRRLGALSPGALSLVAGMTPQEQKNNLSTLRSELVRLVGGFPATLLSHVALNASTDSTAPQFDINLMQQLMMLGINPYFARVLGLYFVDTDVAPGVTYDYCITGYWGNTLCATTTRYPGRAPASKLALGNTTFQGMTLSVNARITSMWPWIRDNASGLNANQTDPGAPAGIANSFATAIVGIAQPPQAMLAVTPSDNGERLALAPPPIPLPPFTLSIALKESASSVDIQLAGRGTVFVRSKGTSLASADFNSRTLQTFSLGAPSPDIAMIDEILIAGEGEPSVFVVGGITTHLLPKDWIGTRCAMVRGSHKMSPLDPPLSPVVATFRHRQADIDTASLKLVPHSRIDVEWPAPLTYSTMSGDPVSDPFGLPVPTNPVGFVAERQDSAISGSLLRLPRIIAAASSPTPTPKDGTVYPIPTPRLYRFPDSGLVDPVGGWQYRIAGFDLFGALGKWGGWTNPLGVGKIAAPVTGLSIQDFDNRDTAGGAPFPLPIENATEWIGGTLKAKVNWAASAFMMYPDTKSARAIAKSIDVNGDETGTLVYQDLPLPAPTISSYKITSVTTTQDLTPGANGRVIVDIYTDTPLPVIDSSMAPAVLMISILNEADPNYYDSTDRYVVRPFPIPIPDLLNPGHTKPGPVGVQLSVGVDSLLVTAKNTGTGDSRYIGTNAYFVQGYSTQLTMAVPLSIQVGEKTARGQLSVQTSISNPFDPNEKIVDPNGTYATRDKSKPVTATFTGALRLLPPKPDAPHQSVKHVYYDPADFAGRAGKDLTPFLTPELPGVSGYVLLRAAIGSLAIADVKRRLGLPVPNASDAHPTITDRPDLDAWIAALPTWLDTCNVGRLSASLKTYTTACVEALAKNTSMPDIPRPPHLLSLANEVTAAELSSWVNAYNAGSLDARITAYTAACVTAQAADKPNPPVPTAPVPFTVADVGPDNVLTDATGQTAFIEHFYGGLLDDELRVLADLAPVLQPPPVPPARPLAPPPDNRLAFARVNTTPYKEFGKPIRDTVDGKGFGRYLYKLANVNSAGSQSEMSDSLGPYYTAGVTPPKPPVIYRVLPQSGSMKVDWMLDANPDVAGYLIYRATHENDLKDLRYFGPYPVPLGQTYPMTSGLAQIEHDPKTANSLSFGTGLIDPRIIGLVPDPRLFARDYDFSIMAEIPLPVGAAPDEVKAVYRLSKYRSDLDPLVQPQAFNYWNQPGGDATCEIFSVSPRQSRLRGLRIGLGGRNVPVVVVARFGTSVNVLGSMASRRASFIDGMQPGNVPIDLNSVRSYSAPNQGSNSYAVVAVDIYGNRSLPSKVLTNTMLS